MIRPPPCGGVCVSTGVADRYRLLPLGKTPPNPCRRGMFAAAEDAP